MPFFQYGTKEIDYLKKKDKRLGRAIDQIGRIERETNPDVFAALIESITSQQISSKAAKTVCSRLYVLAGTLSPAKIASLDLSAIQQCGMTAKKAGYIKGIAEAALSGEVDFANLHMLTDDEIIRKLSSLNGVGTWTAEMLLIFSLQRPNVVSFGDLAIRRGMMHLYNLQELPKAEFERFRKRYSPYGSVASLYLWALSVK